MSLPTFQEFDPQEIPWQFDAVNEFENFDYSTGVMEMLFSGSIGSGKSIIASHLIIRHLIENKGARCLVARRALKDLKRTLWDVLIRHIDDIPQAIDVCSKSTLTIKFKNGSELIGDSYDKGDLEKFRSLELSMVAIEEASESTQDVYDAMKMRVGRCTGVNQNIMMTLTNPAEPDFYLYEKLILSNSPRVKVIYSLTEQNKFLPDWYIENLKQDLSPLMADRMLRGKWISIADEKPYYAFSEKNVRNEDYRINEMLPLDLMFDFNIGNGKPMSSAVGQFFGGYYHISHDFCIHGFRTTNMIEEIINSGILEHRVPMIRVFGDASGDYRDTRGPLSDFDIILKRLNDFTRKDGTKPIIKSCIKKSNPEIRVRQNIVNSKLCNDLNENRLFIYKNAKMVEKGFRLTKLVKGSSYQEDDKDEWQHVITAVGYYIAANEETLKQGKISVTRGR
jgi:hypothetical protein